MNIIIDTNIIINLEDNKILEESFTRFIQLASINNCNIYYHKGTVEDIERDKDNNRKAVTLSKLKKYTPFPNPGNPTPDFISRAGQKSINDEIDNKLLFQAYLNYTDILVTEDKGIQEKGLKFSLKNIASINQAIEILSDKFIFRIPKHPNLEHISLRELVNELNDEFFDSLREDYSIFNSWFKNSAQKNRQSYVFRSNNKLGAILIYKEETAIEHRLAEIYDNALKMCTFKVAETAFGNKLGELFLSKMFALCIEKKIKYLYLTVFEKHSHLISLLEDYGFKKKLFINSEGREELIYIKHTDKPLVASDTPLNTKANHPFYYDGNSIEKYIIPIRDNYYRTLFKDGGFRQYSLYDSSINEIQGNTITKAYVCASPRKSMQTGSLLFFYASKVHQVIEPVGVLESIHKVSDFTELRLFVNKRTVFSEEDLKEMLEEKKTLTILLFRLVYYLRKPVSFKLINQLKSYANKFTTITSLSEEDYLFLKEKNYFDERYIINKA